MSMECKGRLFLGTGCGICERCKEELRVLKKIPTVNPIISEKTLNIWEHSIEDHELLAIIKLARVGLWAENHSVAITDAIKLVVGELPVSKITRFEKAMDACPFKK